MSDKRATRREEGPGVSRRSVMNAVGVATVGLSGVIGTASAGKRGIRKRKTGTRKRKTGKGKRKRGKGKRNAAKAGWVLTGRGHYEDFEGAEWFRVLERKTAIRLPAGCGPESARKLYVRYEVRYPTDGSTAEEYLYRRTNQRQLTVGATYRIKKIHRCDVRGRVQFTRKRQ